MLFIFGVDCCQNYSRSRSRIDIPTCIRYADLCCGRSRIHAKFTMSQLVKQPDGGDDKSDDFIIRHLNSNVQMDRNIKNGLYFC